MTLSQIIPSLLAVAEVDIGQMPLGYWDIFVGKLGAVLGGAVVAILIWLIWTALALVIFRKMRHEGSERWVMIMSGLLAVASALYFGLVFMAP